MPGNLVRNAGGAALVALLLAAASQAQTPAAAGAGVVHHAKGSKQNYGAPIDITQAKAVAAAAEAEARKHNVSDTLTLAIVNTGGDIVYVQRGIAAKVAAMDIALAKARSASLYGLSTLEFYQDLKQGDFKDSSLSLPMAADMGPGGLPIVMNGNIVGAIGVEGGFDEQVAEAGRDALNPQGDSPAASAQQLADEPAVAPTFYGVSVNLDQVKRMIVAAEAEARKRHIASFTMVVDDTNGDLVYAQTAPGARRAVMQIALQKARTAARYGVTSKSLQEKLMAGDLAHSIALPGAATMGWGGVPIVARGRIIGGVAVAGVINPNDNAIASAAAAALADDDPFASH